MKIIKGEEQEKQGQKPSNNSNEKKKKKIKLNNLSVMSCVRGKPCHSSIFFLTPLKRMVNITIKIICVMSWRV